MLFCIITSDDVSLLVLDNNLKVQIYLNCNQPQNLIVQNNICMLEAFCWRFLYLPDTTILFKHS